MDKKMIVLNHEIINLFEFQIFQLSLTLCH